MRRLIPLLLAIAATLPLHAESCGADPQRPMLGVEMSPVTQEVQEKQGLSPDQGVLVRQTFSGTAADAMGIQPGDVILGVNGTAIGSLTELRNEIAAQTLGSPIDVVVRRDGVDLALASTIGAWPESIPYEAIDAEAERRFKDWQQRRLGRQSDHINDLRQQLADLKKARAAENAPGFTQSQWLQKAKLSLALMPPWTFSYDWSTAKIPPARGRAPAPVPRGGDPWQTVAVVSTRFVEL